MRNVALAEGEGAARGASLGGCGCITTPQRVDADGQLTTAPHTGFHSAHRLRRKRLSELLGTHRRTKQSSVTKHAAEESAGKYSDSHLVEILVHVLMMCPWHDIQQNVPYISSMA